MTVIVRKPTKKQLAANAKKMKAEQAKLKELKELKERKKSE